MSDNGKNLRQRRLLTSGSDLRHETSHAFLELAVLGGVYERVDAAVGEHQRHGQVIPPASEVERVAEVVDKEQDLDWRPAGEEYAAYYQPRDKCIPPCFVNCGVTSWIHLQKDIYIRHHHHYHNGLTWP